MGMDAHDEMESGQFDAIARAFRDQLLACLEECARGRRGLFAEAATQAEEAWPEAASLRQLALALQQISAQRDEPNPLAEEFLDLCSIHGESDPGERRLARAFLDRIEKGELGAQPESEARPW